MKQNTNWMSVVHLQLPVEAARSKIIRKVRAVEVQHEALCALDDVQPVGTRADKHLGAKDGCINTTKYMHTSLCNMARIRHPV